MLSTDIIVFGYPKAGNTGLARLIRTAWSGRICNFPGEENWIDSADSGEGDIRVFKTHLPINLNEDCKIVYVIREPLAMALSGFYHNKPWLKGSRLMNTLVGDLFVNLYLLIYGCRWPGLGRYKDHFCAAKRFNATILRYEDIWTENVADDVVKFVFSSVESYKMALKTESKQNKSRLFHQSGDEKSVAFLKEYNRDVIVYKLTRIILKIRSGEVWWIYNG